MNYFLICDSDESFCDKEKKLIEEYFDKKGKEVSVDVFSSKAECLSYIKESMKKEDKYVLISEEKVKIATSRILYVESRLHKIIYHTKEADGLKDTYSVYGKLDDIEAELAPHGFVRTHQSYLVNMSFVKNVERYDVTLTNGTKINISKKYYKDVETGFVRTRGTFL